jgi:hypothetical protein
MSGFLKMVSNLISVKNKNKTFNKKNSEKINCFAKLTGSNILFETSNDDNKNVRSITKSK